MIFKFKVIIYESLNFEITIIHCLIQLINVELFIKKEIILSATTTD